jgi:hypothetical protein
VVSSRQRPNFEIDERSRRRETATRAGVDAHLTRKLSIELAGRREITDYDAGAFSQGVSLQKTLNRTLWSAALTPRFRVTPFTTIGVQTEVIREEFPFEPDRSRDSLRVMPGVEFNPRALISGRGYVGYRRLTPANPRALPAFEGTVANLGLTYRLLTTTHLAVTFVRDVRSSAELLQPYYVDTVVGASLRRGIGRRFDVILSGESHRYDFRSYLTGGSEPGPLATDRRDRTIAYSASLGYVIRRGVRLGFVMTAHDRQSPLPGRSYRGVRFGSDLRFGL